MHKTNFQVVRFLDMINIVKSISLFILITSFGLFISCDKIDFTQFEMDYSTTYTYQAGLGTALPFTARTPEISTNSSSTFSANNTRKDKIEEINIQSMTLKIKSPNSANFDFLNEISISIDADGQDKVVIASKTNIPENGLTTLQMNVEGGVNLKNYVIQDDFVFSTTTKTDKTVNQDITVEIESVFFVDAKLL